MTKKSGRLLAGGAALLAAGLFAPCAVAGEYSQGFTFCRPPFPPPCVTAKLKPKQFEACEKDIEAYVNTVFAYRECRAAETERVVREANDYINAWRCKRGLEGCRR